MDKPAMEGNYNPKYDYVFMKPDKTELVFTGHNMKEMISNVVVITKEHYDLEYPITRNTVYNLMHRPAVAHKFYKAKLKIKKHVTAQTPNK